MTQFEFDPLPVLLHAAQARQVLAGVKHTDFYLLVEEGDLRVFKPEPDQRAVYYCSAGSGRIANLRMNTAEVDRLPERVDELRFRLASGLSELALRQALRSGQLKYVDGTRQLAKAELYAWGLTEETKPQMNA